MAGTGRDEREQEQLVRAGLSSERRAMRSDIPLSFVGKGRTGARSNGWMWLPAAVRTLGYG
jgi:hypothetical protein